jgi:hypothetical protein
VLENATSTAHEPSRVKIDVEPLMEGGSDVLECRDLDPVEAEPRPAVSAVRSPDPGFEVLPTLESSRSVATKVGPGWSSLMKQARDVSLRPPLNPAPEPTADVEAPPSEGDMARAMMSAPRTEDTGVELGEVVQGGDRESELPSSAGRNPKAANEASRDDHEPEIRPVLAPGRMSTFADHLGAFSSLEEDESVGSPPSSSARDSFVAESESMRISETLRAVNPAAAGSHTRAPRESSESGATKTKSPSMAPIAARKLAPFGLAAASLGLIAWIALRDPSPEGTADQASSFAKESTEGAATSPADPRSGMESVAEKVAASAFLVEDLELPHDVGVTSGKGLLEVNTAEKYRIYVDGVFVGPGPVRSVPLSAGQHEVKVKLDGQERQASVEIKVGRRARLENVTASAD